MNRRCANTTKQLGWINLFWDRVLPNVLDCTDVVKSVRHHQEQLEEARRLHHEDLKASVSLHNREVDVGQKMHKQEVKLACKLHDREKEMALAMHNIALQVELLHASCENIRDTAEQYISKISTFLLVETLLLGSLFTVIIEAELPPSTQSEMEWLVLLYSLTSGVSFMTLSSAVYLTYSVQERVLKLRRHALGGAFKAFKEHREHWTQSITKLRDFYFRLESEREHLHDAFDEDIQTTKTLVNHASVAFALGVLTLACSVVTVMFAKLTLGFVHDDGETNHAWAAAYLFTGIFVLSIILLLGLVLREQQTDFLRPVILLRGDYCVVAKVDKIFTDPGATGLDLQQEYGEARVMTNHIKIKIAFYSKEAAKAGADASDPSAAPDLVVPAYLDPKYKVAKLHNWIPDRIGMYVITYFVADERGNEGKASRTVIVTPDKEAGVNMVVPPSSPPPKLRVLERRSKDKEYVYGVEKDISLLNHLGLRRLSRPSSRDNLSDYFANGQNDSFETGPMTNEERASKIFKQTVQEERISLSNLSLGGDGEDGEKKGEISEID